MKFDSHEDTKARRKQGTGSGADVRDEWKLQSGEVYAWVVSLSQSKERMDILFAALSAQEREKAARFRVDNVRNRWIAGRGALREILSRYIDKAPSDIEFQYGLQGKPEIVNQISLQFNISHSDDLAVCAVTRRVAVGVDVEKIRSVPGADQIAKRWFSSKEQTELDTAPVTEKERVFFKIWTRKESILKWSGEGIAQLGKTPAQSPVFIHEFIPASGYVGSLAADENLRVVWMGVKY